MGRGSGGSPWFLFISELISGVEYRPPSPRRGELPVAVPGLGTDRRLPKSFFRSIFGRSPLITSLPIRLLLRLARYRHASPVSIQTKASCRKGRQTGCQAESYRFFHRNINSHGIRLRKFGEYASYEPICRWQHRGSQCHGEA